MNSYPTCEWVTRSLDDIATFLAANGLPQSAKLIEEAATVVRAEVGTASFAKHRVKPEVSVPIHKDNIVRFCVVSRT